MYRYPLCRCLNVIPPLALTGNPCVTFLSSVCRSSLSRFLPSRHSPDAGFEPPSRPRPSLIPKSPQQPRSRSSPTRRDLPFPDEGPRPFPYPLPLTLILLTS